MRFDLLVADYWNMSVSGIFVGFATLDVLHLIDRLPERDELVHACDELISAGGGAANAAVAFAALGGRPTLFSPCGGSSVASLAMGDLKTHGVRVLDCAPGAPSGLGVSSILVDRSTGERAIITTSGFSGVCVMPKFPLSLVSGCRVLLWDGQHRELALPLIRAVRLRGIPVVADCGIWKPWFETDLSLVDYAVCSAVFRPPGCVDDRDVEDCLFRLGVRVVAITHGGSDVSWRDVSGISGSIPVSPVDVVDTLGAGDIFHGAFAFALASGTSDLGEALVYASRVASHSTRFFGARRWIQEPYLTSTF